MKYISGSGAPSINTVANPGDIYIDISTYNMYICREVISQSTNYISDVRTEYRWKRYPYFSIVAKTGSYDDLINKPNIIETINGIFPDSNGNVDIDTGVTSLNGNSGDIHLSYEDLPNTPFVLVSKDVIKTYGRDSSVNATGTLPVGRDRLSYNLMSDHFVELEKIKSIQYRYKYESGQYSSYSDASLDDVVFAIDSKDAFFVNAGVLIFCKKAGTYTMQWRTSPSSSITFPKPGIYGASSNVTHSHISDAVITEIEKYFASASQEIILPSSTEGSSKKFALTIDDTGTISATEVTT